VKGKCTNEFYLLLRKEFDIRFLKKIYGAMKLKTGHIKLKNDELRAYFLLKFKTVELKLYLIIV
jgi:hypothetical protein